MSGESQLSVEIQTPQPEASKPQLSLFFYGTLQNPDFLRSLLSLPSNPTLRCAVLTGFKIKLWGLYPIVVPDENGTVEGMVWDGATEDHFVTLVHYEGSAYTWQEVEVNLLDEGGKGELLKGVRVFVAQDPEDQSLTDGVWELGDWTR